MSGRRKYIQSVRVFKSTRRIKRHKAQGSKISLRNVEQTQLDIAPQLQSAIVDCLVHYWTDQGIDRGLAEIAANLALKKICKNANKGSWCLLPMIG